PIYSLLTFLGKKEMDSDEFRIKGKELIDYIADYMENIKDERVTPDVEPGYLKSLLPREAPVKAEQWDSIFKDFESKILPGITHWQHPRFHAYFPAGNSYPSILGEILSAGLGIVGFSWASSPSCTELETIVMDWLGRLLNLPKFLLPFSDETENGHLSEKDESKGENDELEKESDDVILDPKPVGGGVVLGSASECVLVALLSARGNTLRKLKSQHPFVEDGVLLSKLVMYTSKLAHSCVEKAGMIAMVKIRLLDHDENYSLRGATVEKAIKDDKSNGLIPFFVSCTLGTTSCCSFDNLVEVGNVCKREEVYLHVDGAYAGSALICEEFRYFSVGLEVKDKYMLTKALSVDPIYLRYKEMDKAIDYRHWGIALSRRFRSLKMWFTIRSYGLEGLQRYIRGHVRLAKYLEKLILGDSRFEILGKVVLGLLCFRLKGPNSLSQNLLFVLNDSGKIHMVPSMLDEKYVIRFCVNAENSTEQDMDAAWDLIKSYADQIIRQFEVDSPPMAESTQFPEITSKLRRIRFGISKMVSDPRINGQKKYRRTATTLRLFSDSSKYLARKCSIVEKSDEDLE
ncbi:tyrosine decarboxylase-like, partial [Brachionus plicatilis]